MTDSDLSTMRARLEAFDADRAARRETRRADYDQSKGTGARAPEASIRVAEIQARPADHPLGSIAQPLPMLDPLAESRAKAKATGDRLREVFRDV